MFLRKYVKARHILFLENIIKMFGDKHVVNQGAESYFLNHKLPVSDLDLITSASGSHSTKLREGDMGVYAWYCGIELFFERYFGNFYFNVRYCGIIQPCGMWCFILLANGFR